MWQQDQHFQIAYIYLLCLWSVHNRNVYAVCCALNKYKNPRTNTTLTEERKKEELNVTFFFVCFRAKSKMWKTKVKWNQIFSCMHDSYAKKSRQAKCTLRIYQAAWLKGIGKMYNFEKSALQQAFGNLIMRAYGESPSRVAWQNWCQTILHFKIH